MTPSLIPASKWWHLAAAVLMAGPVSAAIHVEAWYHLSDNAYPQDSSGNKRHFRNPMPGSTYASVDAAGGPLGERKFVSLAALEFGRETPSGCWDNGYTVPNDNVGIEAWVKPMGDGWNNPKGERSAWIFSTGAKGGLNLGIEKIDGTNRICAGLINVTYVGDSIPLNAGHWTHLALVRDRGVTTFYVNGKRSGQSSAALPLSADTFHLGIKAEGFSGFRGLIDEARIFTFAPGQFQPSDLLGRQTDTGGVLAEIEQVPVSRYQVKTWQSQDGLPQNTVKAIAQTTDGYLWVGTGGGLARFDGNQFKVFQPIDVPELGSGRIHALCSGRDGALWITTEEGALVRYASGKFSLPLRDHGTNGSGVIIDAVEDADGVLWLQNAAGEIARWDGAQYAVMAREIGGDDVKLRKDQDGNVLVAYSGGILKLRGDKVVRLSDQSSGFLCPSAQGGHWFTVRGETRWKSAGKPEVTAGRSKSQTQVIHDAIEDRMGRIWLATENGVIRKDVQGGELALTRRNGLESDVALVVFEDRSGGIWIGTDTGGLSRLNLPLVTAFDSANGLPEGKATGLCSGDEDSLWVTVAGEKICQFRGGQAQISQGLGGASSLVAMVRGDDGRIFAGSSTTGLWQKDGANFTRLPGMPDGAEPVRSLLVDQKGALWIGRCAARQLIVLDHGTERRIDLPADVRGVDICALAQDAEGRMWVGTDGRGVLLWHQNQWQRFTRADGLGADVIWSLRADEKGSVWIGTYGGGLSRIKDGKIDTCTTRQGLWDNTITYIEDDGRDNLWCGSHQGVFRVKKADLEELFAGRLQHIHCVSYGISDGMPSLECSGGFQPAGCRTSDGRIWFPTVKGVAMVNPSAEPSAPVSPPVRIDGVTVDGESHPAELLDSRYLVFTTGQRRYRFQYSSVDFTAPDSLRFRTSLEGVDSGWIDAGRESVADYSQLAAGRYTFRVQAQGRDGVWSEPGAELSFEVRPQWWERPLVRIAALLAFMSAAGVGIWAVTRARMKRRMAVLEQQRVLEMERQRIAANIHDDLGASLTRIALLSDLALEGANQGGVGEELKQIHDTASDLTRTMDEIVWAVDPDHDTLDSLAAYLASVAQDLLGVAGLRCRLSIPADLPNRPITGQVRHNLYLVVKEAIHNAIRHASATEVRLAVELEPEDLVITVADDGTGIGTPRVEPGRRSSGHGIKSFSKRMESIGGSCVIDSAPGHGTRLCFRLPLRLLPLQK